MKNNTSDAVHEESTVVKLAEEQLDVKTRSVEVGKVRVHKTVQTWTEVVDVPVKREEVKVERVRLDRVVMQVPPVRYEGEVMIVPVMEELLVVEKRLILREELRITKTSSVTHESQTVTLRKEEATVDRTAL